MSAPTVLILGATGRLGLASARAFAAAGWRVLAQSRRPAPELAAPIVHVTAALEERERLAELARGARAVLYAVNPPYPRWHTEALPGLRAAIRLADSLGATLLFPGNVYNFGEAMPERLREDTPFAPSNAFGELRVAMEAELTGHPSLRSVIVRAGDFFGAGAGAWFDRVIIGSLDRGKLAYAGPLDRVHAWAYVPDLARVLVALAGREDLPRSSCWHYGGLTATGAELLDAVEEAARAVGRAKQPLARGALPWWFLRLGAMVSPSWRAVVDLAYLWRVPHRLDGAALEKLLGDAMVTPWPEALRATLADQLAK